MKSQVLSNFAWTDLTVLAFVIFFAFFIFVLFWTFRKGSKSYYDSAGNIPFDEGEPKLGDKK
jgi:cbb3-type cytochrome oxidase subunit 3